MPWLQTGTLQCTQGVRLGVLVSRQTSSWSSSTTPTAVTKSWLILKLLMKSGTGGGQRWQSMMTTVDLPYLLLTPQPQPLLQQSQLRRLSSQQFQPPLLHLPMCCTQVHRQHGCQATCGKEDRVTVHLCMPCKCSSLRRLCCTVLRKAGLLTSLWFHLQCACLQYLG